ncbi:MAG: VTT domain-containing protein [Wenzhouxiangellaceae bacterium]
MNEPGRSARTGPWILGIFMVIGLVLAAWHPLHLSVLLEWGRWLSDHPVLLVLLVLVMAVLFTFALPASVFVWLVAPFQPPAVAVAILLAGGVLGAVCAYGLAWRLGSGWRLGRRTQQTIALLAKRSDVATQCALRVLPGFPHSVINYAGGILRLPLSGFVVAAVIGLGIKWGVYATAIHRGVGALGRGEVIDFWDLLPLVVLALLLLLGTWVRRMIERRHQRQQVNRND